MGTHAEGIPIITESEEQYVYEDCHMYKNYECDKCGGEFSVYYEIHNGKTKYLKVNYSGSRTSKSGCHTWA